MSFKLHLVNWLLRTFERPALAKIDQPQKAHERLLKQADGLYAPPLVRYHETDLVGEARKVAALVARPTAPLPRAALLFLHGGAYAIGSYQTHQKLAGRIASECNLTTFVANYRVSPEAQFPAAFDDAMLAYEAIVDAGYSQIAIAGDSAGGGLAFALLAALLKADLPNPVAVAGLSPWTDLTLSSPSLEENNKTEVMLPVERMPEMVSRYVGSHDPGDPRISPIFADFTGAPPALVQVSQKEALFDDALRLADQFRRGGSEIEVQTWENTFHVWHALQGKLAEADEAVVALGEFMRAQFRNVTR